MDYIGVEYSLIEILHSPKAAHWLFSLVTLHKNKKRKK